MSRRILSLLSLLIVLSILSGTLQAYPETPPGVALVYIALPTHDDLVRFQRTGLPAYARLYGSEGSYVLVGAGPAELAALEAAGLSVRVLDADTTGATYYVSYPTPGSARPNVSAYGRVLLDDGVQALWRVSPQACPEACRRDAQRLTEAGAELSALPLEPKPLRPAFVRGVIPAVVEPDPLIQTMIDQVSSDTVRQYVGDLSGEWPVDIGGRPFTIATRYTYSGVYIGKATRYVGQHLANLWLDVEYHVWGSVSYPNVIGELRGEVNPEDIYIICAHLDDAPFELVAPGADDNASGSAAVLIAADILSQYRWGSTLRFVLFTGEEQWSMDEYYAHGSYPYVQRSRDRGENIVGVLNLDMLGWNSEGKPDPDIDLEAKASPVLSPTVELAQLFADVVDTYGLNLIPDISPNSSGLGDHGSFWDHGYIAIMGIEDMLDFNPFYHGKNDRLTFLDMDYLTAFVKAAVGTFAHIGGGPLPERRRYLYLPLVMRHVDSTLAPVSLRVGHGGARHSKGQKLPGVIARRRFLPTKQSPPLLAFEGGRLLRSARNDGRQVSE